MPNHPANIPAGLTAILNRQQTSSYTPHTIHHPLEYIDIDQDNSNDGFRVYHTPEKNTYLSVTSALERCKNSGAKEAIAQWQARVGEEEASHILMHSSGAGTWMHENIERFLKGEIIDWSSPYSKLLKQIIPLLRNISKALLLEGELYSDALEIAGTTDCLGVYNGKLSVIDFKNSRSERSDEVNRSYYLQGFLYSVMVKELYGLDVEQVVILVSINSPYANIKNQEFVVPMVQIEEDFSEFLECWVDDPLRIQVAAGDINPQ